MVKNTRASMLRVRDGCQCLLRRHAEGNMPLAASTRKDLWDCVRNADAAMHAPRAQVGLSPGPWGYAKVARAAARRALKEIRRTRGKSPQFQCFGRGRGL